MPERARARAAARARPQEPSVRAVSSGAEAGPELGLRLESEFGEEAGLEAGACTRKEAEPEVRVLATPLGLDPRPEPGWGGPWRCSRFVQ